jgi:hypothetical protein
MRRSAWRTEARGAGNGCEKLAIASTRRYS